MTTRKILISNEYLRLCKQIDNLIDKINILPNIDDHDFFNILYMFNVYFMDSNDSIPKLNSINRCSIVLILIFSLLYVSAIEIVGIMHFTHILIMKVINIIY